MKRNIKRTILAALMPLLSLTAMQAQTLPYQNPALSAEDRAADLCARLTLEEKAKLMMNSSPAIPRLGIPAFEWWSEALHGVGRNGVSTMFPQCIGMAASFDDQLLERIYTAVSDEARAKNTQARHGKGVGKYKGLSFWTPTVNIFRDPRWGRGQESYGEDPYMNQRMGVAVVRGLQGPTGHKYRKLLACAKHFAVHSGPEKMRHSMNIETLDQRQLWETYLPAFKTLVQEGNVAEVMCAYQRYEGSPCCGSNRLLQQILRDEWGFQGLVVSDCGAITDFYKKGRHETSKDEMKASADGVISGTDVECGREYKNLPAAVERGDISEGDIDVSVRRLLKLRFELGDFDDDELVEWAKIPASVVACKEHRDMSLQMARESMVLLKNNGVLPLSKNDGQRILVMGPNAADSTVMWGIYFGQAAHTVTALEGIRNKVGNVAFRQGCDITEMTETIYETGKATEAADGSTSLEMKAVGTNKVTLADINKVAKDADIIIFVGGISPNLEREQARVSAPGFDGGDRTSIEMPQVQREILQMLHRMKKKVVLVNCSGSAVALTPEEKSCDAILQAWYAGEQGGNAIADVLFGDYNPSGKLPITFYKDDSQLPPFTSYSMTGRTYRYMKKVAPLYPFGYGLSYTTFSIGKATVTRDGITVPVKNTGKVDGTEIVQLYVSRNGDNDGPVRTLRGYKRVELKSGEEAQVFIPFTNDTFTWWDKNSNTMRLLPGDYTLWYGNSSAEKDLQKISYRR